MIERDGELREVEKWGSETGIGIQPVKFVLSNQLWLWKAGAQVWWGTSGDRGNITPNYPS